MINVFKKRTRLYALTTSAFFFLQGFDASMAASDVGTIIEPSPVQVGSSKSSCDSNFSGNADAKHPPINCNNGTFTMKGGQISVKGARDNGVHATGSRTNVKIQNASIKGVGGTEEHDYDKEEGVEDAVYAVDGAAVELVESQIQAFESGLEAKNKAVINMKGGDISSISLGVWATNGSSVFLDDVVIDANATALYGANGAGVTMKSGDLSFVKGNSGVMSESVASVKLEGTVISIKDAEEEEEEYATSIFMSHDGFIAFNHGELTASDVIGFWIGDDPTDKSFENLGKGISNEFLLKNFLNFPLESDVYHLYSTEEVAEMRKVRNEIYGAYEARDEAEEKVISTMRDIVGYHNIGSFRVSAGVKSSIIEIKGSDGVGIDFEKGGNKEGTRNVNGGSGQGGNNNRGRMVVLQNANLKVADGVAIYGRNLKGSVLLAGKSEISGDLLLQATSSAHLSVFAHDSTIVGDVSIKDNASAEFFLSDKSEWRLTKSRRKKEKNNDCVDSCITSLNLKNSTFKFSPESGIGNYRTLRIGGGEGVVYNADNAWIHFNVHLGGGYVRDRNDVQVSDRLLIHGDVSGRTTLHINATAGDGTSGDTASGSVRRADAPYSVSLVQVHGKAQEDSFQLNGEYVTLNGYPYQYTLHVYGPEVSQTVKYFDAQLQKGETEFWDFRLENAEFVSYYLYSDQRKSTAAYKSPPQREKTSVVIVKGVEDTVYSGSDVGGVREVSEESENVHAALPVGRTLLSIEESDPISSSSTPTSSEESASVVATPPILREEAQRSGAVGSSSVSSEESASIVATPPISREEAQRSGAVGSSSVSPQSHISLKDVDSDSSHVTIPPIKSAAAMKLSTPVVSEELPAPSNGASVLKPSASVVAETSSASSNGPVGGILLPNSAGKKTVSSTCDAAQNNGERALQTPYSCSDGQSRKITNLILKASDKTQHSMHAKKQNTVIKLEGATISGVDSSDRNNVDFTEIGAVSAVLAEEGAEVILDKKSKITSSVIGLEAQSGGKVTMNDGTVDALYVGALADSGSSINLKDTTLNVTGDLAVAGLASQGGVLIMSAGAIALTKGVAVRSEAGGSIRLDKVNIIAKKESEKPNSTEKFRRAAFLLSDNASVDFKNGNVVTDGHALWVRKGDDVVETRTSRKKRSSEVRSAMNHANIEASTVKVEGEGTYGIYFDGLIQKEESKQNQSKNLATEKANVVKRSPLIIQDMPIAITGTVSLKKTDFDVAKGVAIYGNNSGGRVLLENKTTLSGDLLLKAENDSNISVLVDNSIVTGGVRVNKDSYAKLDLANSSEWILKRSVQKSSGTPDLGCLDSCLSSVRLVNSAINFVPSESGQKYQTLHIGNGKGIVYEAQGDAVIHLNARLNPHDSSGQQVTDQLVIHGDVSGKTKIHVRGDAGNVANSQVNAKIAHSVSVIQVYGQAEKDSFQLDGDYIALANSPYKYTLRAYGPEATSKQEHARQKFVKDGGAFWNFRLENQYVKSAGYSALPEKIVRTVVPQVPTYLVLPNSVFHAGLMDINNQSKQLETLRMTSTGMVEVRENPALYLRGYGGSYRYASDLSALEYGYDGDFDYRGVEAGVLLKTIENTDSALSFGVMGTYGKLSLQPLNVEQSQKSAFDKWTATVYGSMQHNAGFYVDGLLSYGLFKGDVLTLARGKTATLKGNPLNVSLIGGQAIATGYKGFVFDPQVQVVYQHLQFSKARDIDNFDVEMGNLDQWVARVGGRLTKNPTGSEGVNAVAFYGKLYLAHGFGEKQSVQFKDTFKLGAFGSSLEAGVGFDVKLLPQFSLNADVLYQHKLNKAGFSGASFSGGVRYQF
ncbi:autotransporter outer membrane beta-barrel domain-containing protein [Bartonella saheliensis]|uniref:autotransporter outer membrane beta-barrel domain-containing protein n=1 Tax=Bartonella saheliensis TaxID=1457016 RepID=UPI0011A8A249|nr:autotransporter outer membrane beta-barrel domain-containing protein [Bartonella saheliensis]